MSAGVFVPLVEPVPVTVPRRDAFGPSSSRLGSRLGIGPDARGVAVGIGCDAAGRDRLGVRRGRRRSDRTRYQPIFGK